MPSFKVNEKWAKLTKINDHLFIAGVVALKPHIIEGNKITHIVNATVEVPTLLFHGVKNTKLWLEDTLETDLSAHFDIIADQIHLVHSMGGRTLVHCVAGVSRSASLCLAYLMKHERKTLREAYVKLASTRPVVRPNLAFWHQLMFYEYELFGQNTVRFMPIKGSDQQLPDVYVVDIPEEDEEEEVFEENNEKEMEWRCLSPRAGSISSHTSSVMSESSDNSTQCT